MWDVVKHARRKYNVEGVRFARHPVLFNQKIIIGFREPRFAERQAAFGDVGGRQHGIRKVLSKVGNGIAGSGTEVEYPGGIDIVSIQYLFQLPDLVLGEVLRGLAGDSD